jgi:myo-inositol-1(or 4)-monophosphatase
MRNFLESLIKRAGDQLRNYFRKNQKLVWLRKADKEVVIKYDKLSDEFIISQIRKKYPNHNILSEEGGFKKGNSNYLWIVDSLDGSKNFANQNPLFSVCIALMKGNKIILGAVYSPVIGEFFIGERGKGAFFNGKRMRVSEISEIEKSYLVYCEGGEKNRKRFAKIINKIYSKVTDIRKIGSAGLETSWVAAGRAEAYFATKVEPWDVAAGVLLVQEAGGEISDFKGKPWQVKTSNLIFSNKKVHPRVLELISGL